MGSTRFARRSFLKTAAGLAALPAQGAPAGAFTLVNEGSTANAIFIAEGAPEPVVLAARELEDYIRRIGGARLPVKAVPGGRRNLIRIGVAAASLPDAEPPAGNRDAFRLNVTAHGIAMAGANARSTLYAAYELLERLGCRWYSPAEDGEHVPTARTLSLPLSDIVSEAAFPERGIVEDARQSLGDPLWEHRMTVDAGTFLVWMTRNRLNAYRNTSTLNAREFARRDMITRWGSSHTIPRMLDKKLFAEKPELFRMDQTGKRVPDGNVCVTNPETVRLCAGFVMDFLRRNPAADSCSVEGQDIWGGAWCSCENCRVYSPSEQNVILINGIDEILRAHNIKGRCLYSAYRDTLRYNLKKVKLDPEAHVIYYPRERSYGHALGDAGSERNRWFRLNLEDWRRNHAGPLEIGDYYHDSILFYSVPVPAVEVVARDLRDYHGLHAAAVGSFTMGRYCWHAYGPSFYVFARMAWDPTLDPGSLLDEMAQNRYGPAAGSIRSFWREWEFGMRPFVAQGEFETLPVTTDPFIEQAMADFDAGIEHLDKAGSHVGRALAEAGADPYAARVRLQHGLYRLSRAGAEALRHTLAGNYWTAVARRDDAANAIHGTKAAVRGVGYALERLRAARDAWRQLVEIARAIDPEPGSYWVRNPRRGGLAAVNGEAIALLDHRIREIEEIAARSRV